MAGDVDDFEMRAAERVLELGDDINIATFAAMFDFFRASSRIISDLETSVHRPSGLSIAGFRVLFTVWVFGSLEMRQIAQLSGVSRAAVTGVVTTLERDGLAARAKREDDRRLVTVTVTDRGHATLAGAYRRQNDREQEIFAVLTNEELRDFTRTLRKLLGSPASDADATRDGVEPVDDVIDAPADDRSRNQCRDS